jgi:hypothetical protein
MYLAVLLVAAAVTAVVGWLWARSRQAPVSDVFYTFRCPECGQKIRYQAARAGRAALCPRCKRPAALPLIPPLLGAYPGAAPRGPVKVGQRRG